jgi:hypothetical protein
VRLFLFHQNNLGEVESMCLVILMSDTVGLPPLTSFFAFRSFGLACHFFALAGLVFIFLSVDQLFECVKTAPRHGTTGRSLTVWPAGPAASYFLTIRRSGEVFFGGFKPSRVHSADPVSLGRSSHHRQQMQWKCFGPWCKPMFMKKLIFALALPALGMILASCASEQPASTTTTAPPQRAATLPGSSGRPSGMMHGGMGGG